MRVSTSFVCVVLSTVAGLVRAEPLNPKQVSADAKWLVHLNADAMRSSAMIDQGYKERGDKAKAIIEKVPELRGLCDAIDPAKNVQGITLYGTQLKPEGVAILQAKLTEPVLNTLYEDVQKLPDYATSSHGSHEIYTWTHAKGTSHQHGVASSYVQPNMLVFGTSVGEVENALDVLDGKKPNLAGKCALAAPAPAGALLLVRVAGLAKLDCLHIDSPIVKQADVLGLTLGEDNNEAYLTGEILAKDAKTAAKVKETVDNALTAALQTVDDSDLSELLNAIQVDSKDKTVTADVRGPADGAWKYVEKLAQQTFQLARKRLAAQAAPTKK